MLNNLKKFFVKNIVKHNNSLTNFFVFLDRTGTPFMQDNRSYYWANNQSPTRGISPLFSSPTEAVKWLDRNSDETGVLITRENGEKDVFTEIRCLALYHITRSSVVIVDDTGKMCYLTY